MAAKTTVRVAVTNNAAKDDSYSGADLGWLGENGSLKGSLNVLANDPGAAKLYAVHNGLPTASGQMAAANSSSFTVVHDGHSYTGTLTINADGTLGFDLSSLAGHLDSLAQGETLDISIYYTAKMANGALSTAKVSIGLTGSNDAPVATAETVNVFEDGALATGHVDASDVDHGATLSYALISTAPAGFTFNPDGSYSFDPADGAYQHLAAGATDVIELTYEVTDEHGASSQSTITLTVTGVNDPASISGDSDGAVSEDDVVSASGVLTVSDVDDNQAHSQASSQAGAYGAFTVDADGNWSYDLDHDLANSLQGGEEATETFTVTSLDGTASQDVTVTVTGTNDAAVIGGSASGDAYEDGVITASGALTVSDADHDESSFQAQTGTAGNYGAFSVDAGGNWSYTLDSRADALDTGENPVETFTVKSVDGTEQIVSITVHGADEAPTGDNDTSQDYDEEDVNGTDHGITVPNGGSHTYTGGAGNSADLIIASNDADIVNAGGGNDTIYGRGGDDDLKGQNQNDVIYAGSGNDTVFGGNGADQLYGGSGSDTFLYGATVQSSGTNVDTIQDFHSGYDKIDLGGIDANTSGAAIGDQAFAFSASGAAANSVWQSGTDVFADVNGDALADLQIHLAGTPGTLSAGDFVL